MPMVPKGSPRRHPLAALARQRPASYARSRNRGSSGPWRGLRAARYTTARRVGSLPRRAWSRCTYRAYRGMHRPVLSLALHVSPLRTWSAKRRPGSEQWSPMSVCIILHHLDHVYCVLVANNLRWKMHPVQLQIQSLCVF